MKKKILSALMCTIIAAAAFTGCGGAASESTAAPAADAKENDTHVSKVSNERIRLVIFVIFFMVNPPVIISQNRLYSNLLKKSIVFYKN